MTTDECPCILRHMFNKLDGKTAKSKCRQNKQFRAVEFDWPPPLPVSTTTTASWLFFICRTILVSLASSATVSWNRLEHKYTVHTHIRVRSIIDEHYTADPAQRWARCACWRTLAALLTAEPDSAVFAPFSRRDSCETTRQQHRDQDSAHKACSEN